MNIKALFLAGIMLIASLFPACGNDDTRKVVIYTSVDQVFSEPIFKMFEAQTGIKVLPVYDIEAAKTTGLVNRLIAEKNRPQADAFWSGEFMQTILLKEKGLLASYRSSAASEIPTQYIDAEGYWTGLGGRSRLLLINTNLVTKENYPKSIFDLLNTKYPGEKIGMAYPMFGSTATQAAAYYAVMGPEKARTFYKQLHDRGARVVDGVSVVKEMVASGQLMMGLVDTDDAMEAAEKGAPVAMVFLDQDGMGELIIPNTVAAIAGGPNPDEAKAFIDFLLSREIARELVKSGWSHVPVNPAITPVFKVKGMSVKLEEVYRQLELSQKELKEIFIK